MYKPTEVEIERRNRIRLSVCAYAYEFKDSCLISDAAFDKLCLAIRPAIDTGNEIMDMFFKTKFSSCTGQWIHNHPDLKGIDRLYNTYGRKWKE